MHSSAKDRKNWEAGPELPWATLLVALAVLGLIVSALACIYSAIVGWTYQTALDTTRKENQELRQASLRHDMVKQYLKRLALSEEAEIYWMILAEIEAAEAAARDKAVASDPSALAIPDEGELKKNLATLRERALEKRTVLADLRTEMEGAGEKPLILFRNGDVIIPLGDDYFEGGSSAVPARLQKRLRQVFSAAANALLKKPRKVPVRIELVALGDTEGLRQPAEAETGEKILELGVQRARAVYRAVFDTKKIRFQKQKEMMKLTSVSPIGYLEDKPEPGQARRIVEELCSLYDCAEPRKLVLRVKFADDRRKQ